MNNSHYIGPIYNSPKWVVAYMRSQPWFQELATIAFPLISAVYSDRDKMNVSTKVVDFLRTKGVMWVSIKDFKLVVDIEITSEITAFILKHS